MASSPWEAGDLQYVGLVRQSGHLVRLIYVHPQRRPSHRPWISHPRSGACCSRSAFSPARLVRAWRRRAQAFAGAWSRDCMGACEPCASHGASRRLRGGFVDLLSLSCGFRWMSATAASGCLHMSRYRGSEGDAAPGLVGLGRAVGWFEAWIARIGSVVVEIRYRRWDAVTLMVPGHLVMKGLKRKAVYVVSYGFPCSQSHRLTR